MSVIDVTNIIYIYMYIKFFKSNKEDMKNKQFFQIITPV